ncbi:MAG: glycosyltransferase [Pseudomonadota bacterium]
MTSLAVTLVVVSRNRPTELLRLIDCLKHQRGCVFELVLVTNTDPALLSDSLRDHCAKIISVDIENISIMRNLGVRNSTGKIIAFCDDDCLPEPDWLSELVKPFLSHGVKISTGAVIGQNGFSLQWGVTWVDKNGLDVKHQPPPNETKVFLPKADHFVKAQGTNCAFDKKTLEQVDLFDPEFAYFLDETDLCLRLAQKGCATAFVPTARVHHLFAENCSRYASRAPRSLNLIGQSVRHYAAKHASSPHDCVRAHYRLQHARVLDAFHIGRLEARDVQVVLASYHTPKVDLPRFRSEVIHIGLAQAPFHPSEMYSHGVLIVAFINRKKDALKYAKQAQAEGHSVTLVICGFLPLAHRRGFKNEIFVQSGGWIGRLGRKKIQPIFGLKNIAKDISAELGERRMFKKTAIFHAFRTDPFEKQSV